MQLLKINIFKIEKRKKLWDAHIIILFKIKISIKFNGEMLIFIRNETTNQTFSSIRNSLQANKITSKRGFNKDRKNAVSFANSVGSSKERQVSK